MSDYVIYGWQGVLAPTGTSQLVIDRLSANIGGALASTDLAGRLSAQGTEPAFQSSADFRSDIAIEQKRWTVVIRSAKITID